MCLMQFIVRNAWSSLATNCGPLSLTSSSGSPYGENRALKTSVVASAVVLRIGKTSIHLEWQPRGEIVDLSPQHNQHEFSTKVQSTKATIAKKLPLGNDAPGYTHHKALPSPLYQGQFQATTQRTWQVLSSGTSLDGTLVTLLVNVFGI